jgi:hypothetical protein
MADIFISYASEDRAKAGLIGAKCAEQGYAVWWDRNIILGQDYYDQIEAELEASKAVIVLWSSTSVKSPWVKAEANRGAKSDRLLPVLIEDCTIPLRFEILQAANLIGWRGGADNGEWVKLLQKLTILVPKKAANVAPPKSDTVAPKVMQSVANSVVHALRAAGGSMTSNKIFSVFREFSEFTTAQSTGQLWFGFGSKERLMMKLAELRDELELVRSSDGGLTLTLKNQTEAVPARTAINTAQLPSPEQVMTTVIEVLHAAPLPVPLSHVAMVIEAEYGDVVRKSAWLGKKTLKQFILANAKPGMAEISTPTGYLYDPSRHSKPE